jgi:hypothetical protein
MDLSPKKKRAQAGQLGSLAPDLGSEPLCYSVPDEQIKRIEGALRCGLEAVESELIEHDSKLGRTTAKNKYWAESLEQQMAEIKAVIAGLPNSPDQPRPTKEESK